MLTTRPQDDAHENRYEKYIRQRQFERTGAFFLEQKRSSQYFTIRSLRRFSLRRTRKRHPGEKTARDFLAAANKPE